MRTIHQQLSLLMKQHIGVIPPHPTSQKTPTWWEMQEDKELQASH